MKKKKYIKTQSDTYITDKIEEQQKIQEVGEITSVLDEIIKNKNKINCIIIEFHDVDLHIKKIVNFIQKLKFQLTHIHPNNFGGVDNNGNPKVLEITLEKKPKLIKYKKINLPHKLDFKNNPKIGDIKIKFKDTNSK